MEPLAPHTAVREGKGAFHSRVYGLQPTSAIKHRTFLLDFQGICKNEMNGTSLLNIWQMREHGFYFRVFF